MNLDLLRLASLFDPNKVPMADVQNLMNLPPDQLAGQQDIAKTMQSGGNIAPDYIPNTRVSEQFARALQEQPQRPDVSKTRSVLATLAAFGAGGSPLAFDHGSAVGYKFNPDASAKVADTIKYGDFNRETGDWKTKVAALEKGAEEENRENVNNRLLTLGMGNLDVKNKTVDINKDKAAIAKQRADAYVWHQTHPQHKISVDNDGYLIGTNPTNDKVEHVTDADGNWVQSDKLSDEQKIIMGVEGHIKQIKAKGEEDRTTEESKQKNRETNIDLSGDKRIEVDAARGSNKSTTPAQVRIQEYTAAQKAINEHPEWSKYIKMNTNGPGTFTVEQPADENLRHDMLRTIYGRNSDVDLPKDTPADKKIDEVKAPEKKKEDEPRVKISDGKGHFGTVTVSDSKKLPAGWSVVQ